MLDYYFESGDIKKRFKAVNSLAARIKMQPYIKPGVPYILKRIT